MSPEDRRLRIVEALASAGVHWSFWVAEAARIEKYVEEGQRSSRDEFDRTILREVPKA